MLQHNFEPKADTTTSNQAVFSTSLSGSLGLGSEFGYGFGRRVSALQVATQLRAPIRTIRFGRMPANSSWMRKAKIQSCTYHYNHCSWYCYMYKNHIAMSGNSESRHSSSMLMRKNSNCQNFIIVTAPNSRLFCLRGLQFWI